MVQFDTALNNEGWIKGYSKDYSKRSISQIFNESERPAKYELESDTFQEWNSLEAKIEIDQKSDLTNYGLKQYFEIDFGVIWWKHNRFINRELKKSYSNWSDLQILDHMQARIDFNKENKAQIKAKIKKYFDKVLNEALIKYFNEKYLTSNKPAGVDTIKAESIHLKALGIEQT